MLCVCGEGSVQIKEKCKKCCPTDKQPGCNFWLTITTFDCLYNIKLQIMVFQSTGQLHHYYFWMSSGFFGCHRRTDGHYFARWSRVMYTLAL